MENDWLKQASDSYGQQQAPSEDEWLQKAAEMRRRREDERLRTSIRTAIDKPPEALLRAREAAGITGIPTDLVERNPDVERMAREDKTFEALRDTEFARKAFADPEFARVAQDDVETLTFMERMVNGFKKGNLGTAATYTSLNLGLQRYMTDLASGILPKPRPAIGEAEMTDEEWDQARQQLSFGNIEQQESSINALAGALGRVPTDPKQQEFAKLVDAEDSTWEGIKTGAAYMLQNPSMFPVLLSEQAVPLFAAAPIGGPASAPIRSAIASRVSSQAAQRYLAATVPMFTVQFTTNAQMAYGLELLGGINDGMGLEEATGKARTKALVEGAVNGAFAFLPTPPGTTRAGQVLSTFGETTKQGVAGASGATAAAAAVGEDITLSEQMLEFAGEFTSAPADIVLAGLADPEAARIVNDAARAAKAQQVEQMMGQLGEAAQNSRLAERSPEDLQRFMQTMAEDAGVEDIYIDAKAFADYFQQQGLDPRQVASEMPSIADQFDEALATGGDLKINLGEYVARVAPTEHHQGLTPHIRMAPEDMTPAEASQWEQTYAQDMAERADQIAQESVNRDEIEASADRVRDAITQQITATGRFTEQAARQKAELHRAFSVVMGERLGLTPEQVYERFGLRIAGAEAPGQVQMDQGETIDAVRQSWRAAGIDGMVSERNGQIVLDKIVVPEDSRSQGVGTQAMQQLIEYADRTGQPIALTPSEDFGGDKKRLAEFYKRFGFIENKGRDKDFEISEGMYRPARTEFDQAANGQTPYTAETIDIDGVERPARNSEGRPIAQTEEGLRNFWAWFGDSKVVDAEGRPRVVYHGTGNLEEMEAFNPALTGQGNDQIGSGFYFTSDRNEASLYTTSVTANAGPGARKLGGDGSPGVTSVYLAITEPILSDGATLTDTDVELTAEQAEAIIRKSPNLYNVDESPLGDWHDIWSDGIQEWMVEDVAHSYAGPSLVSLEYDFFKSDATGFREAVSEVLGYDGVIQRFSGADKQHYVAWFPTQIKSAIGNRGTFDPNDPRILYQDEIDTTIGSVAGITVEELTDEEAAKFREVFARLADVRSEGRDPAGDAVYGRTIAGNEPDESWAVETSIRHAGGPVAVFRGARNPLQANRFELDSLGYNTGHPSSGLGVWFTTKADDAAQYGSLTETFHIDVRNPKVFKPGVEDVPQFDSVDDAFNYRESLRLAGYDGIVLDYSAEGGGRHIVAFEPDQVIRPQAMQTFFQSAYHGTPHTFDKFSLDAIGTGEGAQAYGWGLYFAGKREIAEYYRDALAAERFTVNGEPVTGEAEQIAVKLNRGMSIDEIRAEFEDSLERAREHAENSMMMRSQIPIWEALLVALDEFPADPKVERITEGNLYQVAIPDDDQLLDWDKPLSEQPDKLAALRTIAEKHTENGVLRESLQPFELESTTGEAAYRALATDLSISGNGQPEKTASMLLNEYGIPGLRYLDGTSRSKGEGTYNYVIWDEDTVTVEAVNDELRQAQEQEFEQRRRGMISMFEDVAQGESVITLLEGADLSTFLHETGHFFFEVYRSVASQPDAPADVQADMQALLDFVGVESLEAWNLMTPEQRRAGHEKVAEAFEVYLFEGKAPSSELRSVFRAFRAWLTHVYRMARQYLAPEKISPDVRGVFDRMLATQEQIESTKRMRELQPLFRSADEAGMSPDEWSKYQALVKLRDAEAIEDLERRSLRDMQWLTNARNKTIKKLQKKAEAKRTAIRAEVAEEVYRQPVYAARQFLQRGEMIGPDGEQIKVEKGHKLNLDAVKELYPKEELGAVDYTRLGYGKYGMLAENGLDPEIVAEMFGFASGDALIRALLDADKPSEVIEGITDQRMIEEYGELSSPDAIEAAANEALHNEAHKRMVATELKRLNANVGDMRTLNKMTRDYARQKIAEQKVRDVKPHRYSAAESRAGKKAMQALGRGNREVAAQHKREQVLAGQLYRAAQDANTEMEKARDYFKKFARDGVRKNLRGDAVDQIDALLARFDLRKTAPKTQTPLAEWMQDFSAEVMAVMPDIDPRFLNETFRKPINEMTVEEVRGLRDTVKQLEHMARREQKMYLETRNQSFAEEKAAILDELRAAYPEQFDEAGEPVGFSKPYVAGIRDKLKKLGQSFEGEMLNVETLVQLLTGGNFGPLHDALVQRLSDRSDWKVDFQQKLADFIKPFFDAYSYPEKMAFGKKGISIPEVGVSLTREQIVTVALYYGSETGRQRLRDGHGWGDAEVQAIIAKLDEKDWNLVDAIWRMNDEIVWPELEGVNKRTQGKAPEKVEALRFRTPFGEARGGYFPIVYDSELDYRQSKYDEGEAVQNMLGGNVWRANTPQGSSKARLAEVNKRLVLDFTGMNKALGDTIHDIAFREAVADTYRILGDKQIRAAIEGIAGVDVHRALEARVRNTAAVPMAPIGMIEKTMGWARRNTLIVAMGFSIKTFLINATGIFASAARVSPTKLAVETAKFFSPKMGDRYRFVMDRSRYMAQRNRDFDRDLTRQVNKLRMKKSFTPDVATALVMVGWMDRAVSIPTWLAAYDEAINGKVQGVEAADEQRAIAYADHVVRQTQGSGREVDVAKIMEGGKYAGLKNLFTMFYSYFNAQLAQLVRSGKINSRAVANGDPWAIAKLAGDFMAIVVLPAVSGALLYGNCDKDVEENGAAGYAGCFTRESALFMAGFVPIFRDVFAGVWRALDDNTPYYGYQISPAQSAFDGMIMGFKGGYDIASGEGNQTDAKQVTLGVSYALGLPGYQMWRSMEHAANVIEGDSEPNPYYLLMGEPRD